MVLIAWSILPAVMARIPDSVTVMKNFFVPGDKPIHFIYMVDMYVIHFALVGLVSYREVKDVCWMNNERLYRNPYFLFSEHSEG